MELSLALEPLIKAPFIKILCPICSDEADKIEYLFKIIFLTRAIPSPYLARIWFAISKY